MAASSQRRLLAVLATVARSGSRGVSRDHLAALLWPESEEEQARNALRQLLFRVRRELGTADAVVGTTQLWLNAEIIAADVAEFDAALDAGDRERATALYRGPFLDGFHVPGAAEFERWVELQRRTLATRAAGALEQLARAADDRGDDATAIAYWRTLVTHDPLDTRAAVGFVRALMRVGDPTGALQQARLHEILVRQELGVEADREIVALMESARAAAGGSTPRGAPVRAPPVGRADALSTDRRSLPASPITERSPADAPPAAAMRHDSPAAIDPRDAPSAPVEATETPRRSWRRAAIGVVVLTLLTMPGAAGWDVARTGALWRSAPLSPDRLAVFPFVLHAPAAGDSLLGHAAGQMLSTALDGVGTLHAADVFATPRTARDPAGAAADPRVARRGAARLGAGRFVLGRLVVSHDRVLLTAALHASEPGRRGGLDRIAEVTVRSDRANLGAAIDELAIRLVGAAQHERTARFTRSAAQATRSLEAFRAFLAGEAHFGAGRYGLAVDEYQRALKADSLLAIAYYRMGVAADWASRPVEFEAAVDGAARLQARLPYHERLLVAAFVAWHRGRAAEAERHLRLVVTHYPDDAEAWYQLCEVQFHLGPLDGRPVLDSREACERALAYGPGSHEALVHLFRLAAKARDRSRMDTFARRLLTRATPAESISVLTLQAFALRAPAARSQLVAALRQSADETVLHAAIKVAVYAEDPAGASRIAALLTGSVRAPPYRSTGALYLALLESAGGHRAAADSHLVMAESVHGIPTVAFRALLASTPLLAPTPDELVAWRDGVRRWVAAGAPGDSLHDEAWPLSDPRLGAWVIGLLSLRLGDVAAAEESARMLEGATGPPSWEALAGDLARTLRAEMARARGEPARALALVAEVPPHPGPGLLGTVLWSRVYQRFLRAELLRELGRDEEALAWYGSIGGLSVPELPFLAASRLRQAEMLERRRDPRGAAEHYRRFVELWRECDPELRPLVRDAERRLARLAAPVPP